MNSIKCTQSVYRMLLHFTKNMVKKYKRKEIIAFPTTKNICEHILMRIQFHIYKLMEMYALFI